MRSITCSLRLVPELDWGEVGRQVSLTITGVMKQKNYSDSDEIRFHGSLSKKKFEGQNVKKLPCLKMNCASYLFFSAPSCNDSTNINVIFGLVARLNLPVIDNVFEMNMEQSIYAQTRVEIILRNIEENTHDSLSLDDPQVLSEVVPILQQTFQVQNRFNDCCCWIFP